MKHRAFSLMELMIVIVIIGILAAVGVVIYSEYTASAKVKICKINHDQITKSVDLFLMDCGVLGKQNIDLVSTIGKPSPTSCNNTNDTLATQFMSHFEGKKIMSTFEPHRPQVESGDNPQTGKSTIFGKSPQTGSSTKTITVSSCCDNKFNKSNSCRRDNTLIMKTYDCYFCR